MLPRLESGSARRARILTCHVRAAAFCINGSDPALPGGAALPVPAAAAAAPSPCRRQVACSLTTPLLLPATLLSMQNPTDERIAFKVKTTAPMRYTVRLGGSRRRLSVGSCPPDCTGL